jgi:hypothetical protein
MQPLSSRLLVVTGDQGPGARRVHAVLPDLPRAETAVLRGYAGLTWSDLAAERGDEILDAMQDFLSRHDANPSKRPADRPEGEIAGISIHSGTGPPLVLLLLNCRRGSRAAGPGTGRALTTITLGGAHLGRSQPRGARPPGYIGVARPADQLAIQPGEQVVGWAGLGCDHA